MNNYRLMPFLLRMIIQKLNIENNVQIKQIIKMRPEDILTDVADNFMLLH